MNILICFILAYLLGAIPSGFILGKLQSVDIREHGSKNIGATNTFRVLGPLSGIISLIFDIAKGFFAIRFGRILLNNYTAETLQILLAITGLLAIMGHVFPVFLKFKGGKGVATGAGVFFNILPIPSLAALVVFVLTLIISRYVSLSSIVAICIFFLIEFFLNLPNFPELTYLILAFIIMILILVRHRTNLNRLKNGEEPKIKI